MKPIVIFLLILSSACILNAQNGNPTTLQRQQITKLINQYAQSRLVNDTLLLKPILTADVDQLISTGEWRIGVKAAVDGMLASSKTNPGSRTLVADQNPGNPGNAYWMPFFNKMVPFLSGPEKGARSSNDAVIFAHF